MKVDNEISADTQAFVILGHLKRYGSIMKPEALEICGSERLAARINDLRNAGWPIKTERVKLGNRKTVARYTLDI